MIEDAGYVSQYAIDTEKGSPEGSRSRCAWSEGVPTLLPTTDRSAFVHDPSGTPTVILVPWADAAPIIGHHFKPAAEQPPRTRMDTFPTAAELSALQNYQV